LIFFVNVGCEEPSKPKQQELRSGVICCQNISYKTKLSHHESFFVGAFNIGQTCFRMLVYTKQVPSVLNRTTFYLRPKKHVVVLQTYVRDNFHPELLTAACAHYFLGHAMLLSGVNLISHQNIVLAKSIVYNLVRELILER